MNKKEMESKIVALRKSGKSIREIARAIHKDDSFVSNYLKAKKLFAATPVKKPAKPAKKAKKATKPAAKKTPAQKPCAVCSAKKVSIAKKDAADKSITVKAAKPAAGKVISVKPASKKPIQGTDTVRIPLPAVKKPCPCCKDENDSPLQVEINVSHVKGIFDDEQMKAIDILSHKCSDAIIGFMRKMFFANLAKVEKCAGKKPVKKPSKPAKKPVKKPAAPAKKPASKPAKKRVRKPLTKEQRARKQERDRKYRAAKKARLAKSKKAKK